ncbi:MAG: hypothetical protein WCQ49_02630 [Candidatus Saccharibacteria bacterium]
MQPEDQNNYWAKDETEEADKIAEVYAPVESDDIDMVESSAETDDLSTQGEDEPIHWMASEYISREKNTMWFVIFGIVVVALIAADILFMKSYTFSVLVAVMAAAIIVFAMRPPREINYTVSGRQGLYIGEKLYHFSEFRSFGVINDDGSNFIMLIPVKRFALGVSVYFPEEIGEELVDIFGARLPMQEVKLDFIDVIVRKLRL